MSKPKVTKLAGKEKADPLEEAPSSAIVVRWIVPAGAPFPVEQHAQFTNAEPPSLLTACGSYHVEGGIYPAADGVPRCDECVSTLARLSRPTENEDA